MRKIGSKTVVPREPARFFQRFDLLFDQNPLIFNLNPDIIKTNILGKLKKI